MRYILPLLFLCMAIMPAADMPTDRGDTARNARAKMVTLCTSNRERTDAVKAAIDDLEVRYSLAAVDSATFGFLVNADGDNMVAIGAGSKAMTSTTARWKATDVGRVIHVAKAGPASAVLVTTIASYVNAGSITLTDAATTAVVPSATSAGGVAVWGDPGILTMADDPLRAGNANVYAQTLDLSLSKVTPTGGTTSQTVSAWLGERANVRAYGAKGDGVTNDSTAFQAAIDSAKQVDIPPGNYALTTGLVLRLDSVLSGAGRGITVLKPAGGIVALGYTHAHIHESTITLRDFSIIGDNTGTGILLNNCAHASVINVTAESLATGMELRDALINTFQRFFASACTKGVHINADAGASLNSFYDGKWTNNVTAIYCDSTTDTSAYGNTFWNCDLEFNGDALNIAKGMTPHKFVGSYFEADSSTAGKFNLIKVNDTAAVVFQDCGFGDTGADATYGYFDPANTGTCDIVRAISNTSGRRICPPNRGSISFTGSPLHDALVPYSRTWSGQQSFMPVTSSNAFIGSQSAIFGYIFGSAVTYNGAAMKNIMVDDPGLVATWIHSADEPTNTADPLGGTSAVLLKVGQSSLRRQSGGSVAGTPFTAQAYVQCRTTTPIEFQLILWNNNAVISRRLIRTNGLTGWQLIHETVPVTTAFPDDWAMGFYVEAADAIAVWEPQLFSNAICPMPILAADTSVTGAYVKTGRYTKTP